MRFRESLTQQTDEVDQCLASRLQNQGVREILQRLAHPLNFLPAEGSVRQYTSREGILGVVWPGRDNT
jgi:hypothetical protein